MQKRIEAREGILMPQFEPAAVGPRIRVPTLVVHDRGDSINRFADGQAYAHAIRGAQLVATEGLGHRKILKDAAGARQGGDLRCVSSHAGTRRSAACAAQTLPLASLHFTRRSERWECSTGPRSRPTCCSKAA